MSGVSSVLNIFFSSRREFLDHFTRQCILPMMTVKYCKLTSAEGFAEGSLVIPKEWVSQTDTKMATNYLQFIDYEFMHITLITQWFFRQVRQLTRTGQREDMRERS